MAWPPLWSIIAGAALWQFFIRPTAPPVEKADPKQMALPLPELPSIAVLPFVNLSEDPKQELLCDGITDNIINAFSKVPQLFVIARNSTFTYKGKAVKVKQVSEELGVRVCAGGQPSKVRRPCPDLQCNWSMPSLGISSYQSVMMEKRRTYLPCKMILP